MEWTQLLEACGRDELFRKENAKGFVFLLVKTVVSNTPWTLIFSLIIMCLNQVTSQGTYA